MIRSLDYHYTCGNVYFGIDYIYDVVADKKEHIYLATERGVIILPNPSPVKAQAPSGSAKLNVYPNPATSSVTVDLPPDLPPDASLTVLNITGSALIQQPIRDIGTMQVDVSALAAGSYLVQIRTMKDVSSAGFVVRK
ncbi:MAG: T9SS type A sorting domain-containing protein [Candidatus Kapabacteria bacterium]|nr:T9SS type A sorting domain-containing protein [Ignavibacteria bacterium]MBK7577757.1 T9SS type A sorting domain-containing protein [Ignavibacteria bacterium]MBL0323385.1 T9SS type A sorting domain-containing protein [Ignavibacteria bacterium]MBP6509864.1 T9SS type A sorting domain-containing protein [Candidatus Kapabacteria bacterium]